MQKDCYVCYRTDKPTDNCTTTGDLMEVILLGTGSPMPDAKRGGPATLVKAGATQILVDAGRAVVMRLTGAG